jgi:hypothetical protein
LGLLGLLDEESRRERSTANSLLVKFDKALAEEPLYVETKGNYSFKVIHYAGEIEYHTDGCVNSTTLFVGAHHSGFRLPRSVRLFFLLACIGKEKYYYKYTLLLYIEQKGSLGNHVDESW